MAELEEGAASSSGYESDDDDSAADAARQAGRDGGNGAGVAAEEGGSSAGGRVVGCGCEAVVDLDFDPGRLDAAEQRLLSACRALMEAATGIVRALGRALLQGACAAFGVVLAGARARYRQAQSLNCKDRWLDHTCCVPARLQTT
jgi:hypothetical protein